MIGQLYLFGWDRRGRTGPDIELDSSWSIALPSLTVLAPRA